MPPERATKTREEALAWIEDALKDQLLLDRTRLEHRIILQRLQHVGLMVDAYIPDPDPLCDDCQATTARYFWGARKDTTTLFKQRCEECSITRFQVGPPYYD